MTKRRTAPAKKGNAKKGAASQSRKERAQPGKAPLHRRIRAHLAANSFKLRLTLGFAVIAAIVFGATILLLPDPTPRLIAITCVLGALSVLWFYVRVSYWEMQGIEAKAARVTRARPSARRARARARRP